MKRKQPLIPFTQTGIILLGWAAFLFLMLFLTACSAETAAQAYIPDGEQEEVSLTYLVDQEPVEDSAAAEDGTILATCSYHIPLMTVLRRDGTAVTGEDASGTAERSALSAANTFNGEFRRWAAEADFSALADTARQDYASRVADGGTWMGYYTQSLNCDVYQTDRLVSVAGLFYYSGGGVHPNRIYLGWNFDTRSGAFVSPDQLFDNTAAVAEELVRMAEERAAESGSRPEEFYWPDYRELLSNWDAAAVTFSDRNMTVSWSPYDLAAYAAGEQVFSLPLTWLRPYLSGYGRDLLNVI